MSDIEQIAQALVREGKGILAADESTSTANKRFKALGIAETEEMRRQWRQLLLTTEGIEESLSGVILYDETIRQSDDGGKPFREILVEKGIIPGIKVDGGTLPMSEGSEEVITQGLEGLPERLKEYYDMGARFAKWRGVIKIDSKANPVLPTQENIEMNADIFAQYAKMCQTAGIVPIVEPEVLLDGDHTIAETADATQRAHKAVFEALNKHGVNLKGMILKTGMVLPGKETRQASPEEVAKATVDVLLEVVPEEVSGVVFLSGGQEPIEATENLNEISKLGGPWPMTFSYARAIQQPVMDKWGGKSENVASAQAIYKARLKAVVASLRGEYDRSEE